MTGMKENSGETLFVEGESNNRYISIIVPVYNVESYLRECLDSIVGQTYPLLDIIVVNDGSTDGSGAICDEYAERDSRIRVVHKKNGGLSSARNAGLDLVKGEFIAFVDSDDYLLPNAMELCMEKFTTYPDLSLVRYAWLEFDETGKENLIYSLPWGDKILDRDELFKVWMRAECSHSAWSGVYRLSLLKGLKFQEGIYAEDLEFAMQFFTDRSFNTLFIADPLYMYRVNSSGITQSKTADMWRDAVQIWIKAIDRFKQTDELKAGQTAYGLFLQLKILENRYRHWRTKGEALKKMQEALEPGYHALKGVKIDWSLSNTPVKDFVYWHFPKLWRLLRPRDWGVESIRK